MALNTGLVSEWEMEQTGGLLLDGIGANHLTPGTGVTFGDTQIGFGNGILVNGAGNAGLASITDAEQSGLNFGTGEFTIESWVKLSGTQAFNCDCYLVAKWSPGFLINIQRLAGMTTGNVKVDIAGSGPPTGSIQMALGVRHQIVVLRRSTGILEIWVDGVLDVSENVGTASLTNSEPFTIGGWTGVNSSYVGPIDRTRAWNRALSAVEVASLYNGGAGQAQFGAPPTGPIIASVNPTTGIDTGGAPVTISGANFQAGATVMFDTTPAIGVAVMDSGTITCNAPAHAAGAVDVKVTNPDTTFAIKTGAFTYQVAGTITTGLLGAWKCEESSGDLVSEMGGPTFQVTGSVVYGVAGKVGNAIELDGISAGAKVPAGLANAFNIGLADKRTFGMWINPYELGQAGVLLAKRNNLANTNRWEIISIPQAGSPFILQAGFRSQTPAVTRTTQWELPWVAGDGDMHLVFVTYERATAGIWVYAQSSPTGPMAQMTNIFGEPTQRNTSTQGAITNSFDLSLGLRSTGALPYPGMIDEVMVWDRILTLAEMDYINNNGAGRDIFAPTGIRGIRGWSPDPIALAPGERSLMVDHDSTTGLQDLYIDGMYTASRYVSLTSSDSLNYKQQFERKAVGSGEMYVDDIKFTRQS